MTLNHIDNAAENDHLCAQQPLEMRPYVGTKLINAAPMTRHLYNNLRGWDTPTGENADDPGYLVEYLDGGKPNHFSFEGYISWSPKDVFERAYRSTSGAMNFGDALLILKAGKRVARRGWNGKGMFVFLVPGSTFTVNRAPLLGIYPPGTPINYHAHIDMKCADGSIVPWICGQLDVLNDDWTIVVDEKGV